MDMKTIRLCMKYDTCKRCPRNMMCEAEYNKAAKKNSKDAKNRRGEIMLKNKSV